MSNSDNEKGQFAPDQSKKTDSLKVFPELIHFSPLDIDLTQPDTLPGDMSREITNFPDSKLIGDIFTPTGHLTLMYIDGRGADPRVMLKADSTPDTIAIIRPGETFYAGDFGEEDKCIITFETEPRTVSVKSHHPEGSYHMFAKANYRPQTTASDASNYTRDPEDGSI